MRFRPLPLLTLFAIPSLVLLIWLGSWQMQRMSWKADLLDAWEARGEVASIQAALCGRDEAAAFGPRVSGPVPLSGPTLRYYDLRDGAGWAVIGLMRVPACEPGAADRLIFVETAYESFTSGARTTPQAWRLDPLPAARGFGSRNDPDTNQWYVFDPAAMAEALGATPEQVASVWLRSDTGMPASLTQTPPAKHLGYALTWYGLALALIAVYFALHASRGRLGRTPEEP
ncbi:MAG: hypothetical protein CMC70_06615 [Flavobacteriaceae bacterium]|nr:hypothetical protein [Flavobacteriaceae bacterium]